ncbi:protein of unknown function [Pararobbsia alpina]
MAMEAMAEAGSRNTTRGGANGETPAHAGPVAAARTEKERGAGSAGSRPGTRSRYSIREGLRLPASCG